MGLVALSVACASPATSETSDGEASSGGSSPTDASSTTEPQTSADSSSTGLGSDPFLALSGCEETDFEPTPFLGSAFDPETGELLAPLEPPYVVAATAGWVTDKPEDAEALGMQSQIVSEDIFSHDGLIGVAFGGSDLCGSARTLSIWEDEKSMWAFVFASAHGEAMKLVPARVAAWGTTHWTESESVEPPTFEDAHQRIVDAH
ncbi:MAG: DUF3291 domain-containing protein [Nannocystaceae bacterium]|nr:DUF3291 domain-containing protein [Nannocystaceae bacterium]